MAIDFRKHMTSEQRERFDSREAAFKRDVEETVALSNAELCERAEYYLKNCEFPRRFQRGEPVYDGVIAHVILPELIRRVRGANG